jgi:hypothetical protein
MVSSSKKGLSPTDISDKLESDEFVERLSVTGERKLADTDESSVTGIYFMYLLDGKSLQLSSFEKLWAT